METPRRRRDDAATPPRRRRVVVVTTASRRRRLIPTQATLLGEAGEGVIDCLRVNRGRERLDGRAETARGLVEQLFHRTLAKLLLAKRGSTEPLLAAEVAQRRAVHHLIYSDRVNSRASESASRGGGPLITGSRGGRC